jgi:ribose transport system substrate-binding protein
MKVLMVGVAAAALLATAVGAQAQGKKYSFALVPKNMNNPFFDQARDGCKKAEKELQGAIECVYIGPGEHGGGDEQVQVVNDLITKRVDGIAVSPANAAAMGRALEAAKRANIPVLTWDSDLLDKDKALRIAYVGTYNYEIGVNLAKLVMGLKPKGGTICIQSGGGEPQRAHAGYSRHALGEEIGRGPWRPALRCERMDGDRRLPALHR